MANGAGGRPKGSLDNPYNKENNVENRPTLRGNKLPKKLQKLELRRGLKKMLIKRPSRMHKPQSLKRNDVIFSNLKGKHVLQSTRTSSTEKLHRHLLKLIQRETEHDPLA